MTENDVEQLRANNIEIAVLKEQCQNTNTTLDRIENNHLVHLSEDIKEIEITVKEFTIEFRNKMNQLENVQVGNAPAMKYIGKVAEVVVTGLVIAILVSVGLRM